MATFITIRVAIHIAQQYHFLAIAVLFNPFRKRLLAKFKKCCFQITWILRDKNLHHLFQNVKHQEKSKEHEDKYLYLHIKENGFRVMGMERLLLIRNKYLGDYKRQQPVTIGKRIDKLSRKPHTEEDFRF